MLLEQQGDLGRMSSVEGLTKESRGRMKVSDQGVDRPILRHPFFLASDAQADRLIIPFPY